MEEDNRHKGSNVYKGTEGERVHAPMESNGLSRMGCGMERWAGMRSESRKEKLVSLEGP